MLRKMWSSGLCRAGDEFCLSSPLLAGVWTDRTSFLLDIVLRRYRAFRKARSLPSSPLLAVCPYVWKVMTSSVDDFLWLINLHPKSEFSVGVLPRRRCFSFFPTQETPLKTHK